MTGTILYVEDDGELAATIIHLIKRTAPDAHVIHTLTVDAAITALGICHVQLVISDYNLFGPRKGIELLEHVRAMRNSPPFVFLSDDERCGGNGVPWLRKPCAPREIREMVLAAFDPPKVVLDLPLCAGGAA